MAAIAATVLMGVSACGFGVNTKDYAKAAETAGVGEAVSYEAISAGLPNSDVRAHVNLTHIDSEAEKDALVELLEKQRIMSIEVTYPNGETGTFQEKSQLDTAFSLPEVEDTLPGISLWAGGRGLLVKGNVTSGALSSLQDLASEFETVSIVGWGSSAPDLRFEIIDGIADPDQILSALRAAAGSAVPVTRLAWDDGVRRMDVEVESTGSLPANFRSSLRWVDPYLYTGNEGTPYVQVWGADGKVIETNLPLR